MLDLLEYRRLVAESYARVRAGGAGEPTWLAWRADRDALFANHPQSPVEDRQMFTPLPYFGYDPAWRTVATFEEWDESGLDVANSDSGSTRFNRAGRLHFELNGVPFSLAALWLDAYAGGLFLPFRDETNRETTYGGGRYLLDTAKGADLGHHRDSLILDFNYSYHPSCVHSPRWSCPLAPAGNSLDIAVEAGERLR